MDFENYKKEIIKTLLENQRKMNEQPQENEIAQFKRISIPLVKHMYPTYHLIGVYIKPPSDNTKHNWKKEGF